MLLLFLVVFFDGLTMGREDWGGGEGERGATKSKKITQMLEKLGPEHPNFTFRGSPKESPRAGVITRLGGVGGCDPPQA